MSDIPPPSPMPFGDYLGLSNPIHCREPIALWFTKDYDGNRNPSAKPQIKAVNFKDGNGDEIKVPIEMLRAVFRELMEEEQM